MALWPLPTLLIVCMCMYIHTQWYSVHHTIQYSGVHVRVCVCVCVYVYNMLHMVGTHSPSVSSGSGVFSLPEEGKTITQYRPYLHVRT